MAESPIHAVHDDDLPAVLEALGLAQEFNEGTLRCKFSEDVLTLDNLHSLFSDGGNVKLVCSKPECVKALLQYLDQHREQ